MQSFHARIPHHPDPLSLCRRVRAAGSALVLAVLAHGTAQAQDVTVVNMVPNTMSGETAQDSEPNLAVNPNQPAQIAGSAFTPSPSGGTTAPIYVSTDGGLTWTLNNIVPSQSTTSGTGDITLRFGLSSDVLYGGILRLPGSLRLNVLRTNNFLSAATMTVLVDRTNVDQPYVQATSVLGGSGRGDDRVYVGINDFAPGSQTATIEQSLDAAITTPTFQSVRIESRTTGGQDGPPIRPAIHPDGTVYAIFYGWRSFSGTAATTDVVVVRDDSWGTGATPFTDLADPSDSLSGRLVVEDVTVPWANFSQTNFGQERFVGSNVSIAVDPRDSSRVYIAWADRVGTTDYTLHVRRSVDRGVTWTPDVRTITNATNPALAINSRGDVGFLYQQVVGTGAAQRWETRLERSSNDFATRTDLVLADVPAGAPAPTFIPYIGDYVHLMAVGKDFYGIFSANNTPDNANFPNGVTYQRNADFTSNTLLAGDGTTAVDVSIDPFFFHVQTLERDEDFYVSDWTDSASSFDPGAEPSTHPVFYKYSDVWNRRSDAPGGFDADNRPQSQDPQMVTSGSNYAFARIRRNLVGSAANVSAHFLVSEFGTGSNYQNANSTADPVIAFAASDAELTMANGYEWLLPVTSSSHTCLAVEIDAPGDSMDPPSLLGRAPGWPTTDLMVINDNNKAQRNMGVYPGAGSGTLKYYAVLHNAATFRRAMQIDYSISPRVREHLEGLSWRLVGDRTRPEPMGIDGSLTTPVMNPCENRWLEVSVAAPSGGQEPLPIEFFERVGNAAVNGFAIAVQPVSLDEMAHDVVAMHARVFLRAAALLSSDAAKAESAFAAEIDANQDLTATVYAKSMADRGNPVLAVVQELIERADLGDPLELREAAEAVAKSWSQTDASAALPQHSSLLHGLDAFLTMAQKRGGDTADIVQTLEWQREILARVVTGEDQSAPVLARDALDDGVQRFVDSFRARELHVEDYPEFVQQSLPSLRILVEYFAEHDCDLSDEFQQLERTRDPSALQRWHCEFVRKVQDREEEEVEDQRFRGWAAADVVFRGRVVEVGGSTVAALPGSALTTVVQVEELLKADDRFRGIGEKQVTLLLDEQVGLKPRSEWIFFADGWLFGGGVALRNVRIHEGGLADQQSVTQAIEQHANEVYRVPLEAAEIVLIGAVESIERARPDRERRTIVSEHDPQFLSARVRVREVLSGDWREDEIEVWFAGSLDVAWVDSPKLAEGQEAILLLHRDQRKGLFVPAFTVLDAVDVKPLEELDRVRAALGDG